MESRKEITPTEIEQNWEETEKVQNNPCHECPRRDENGKLPPYFAVAGGNLQYNDDDDELSCENLSVEELSEKVNVVFVGEAPGGTKSYQKEGDKPKKRTAKNTDGEYEQKSREYPLSMYDKNGEPKSNVGHWEKFAIQLAKHWPSEKQGELGIYYTNHTKCSDIHFKEEEGRKVDRGGCHCRHYLVPELRYLDPDAVVVFSGNRSNHLRQALSDLGIDIHRSGKVKEVVFQTDKLSAEDPEGHPFVTHTSQKLPDTTILASYHWQRGMSTVGRAVSGPKVYLHKYLPDDSTKTKTLYAAGIAGAIIEETH